MVSRFKSESRFRLRGWRGVLSRFPSQVFLIPQGTGILAAILHQLQYQFKGLHTISVILWFIAFITLFTFFALYLLKALLYPGQFVHAISHNTVEAACLASISISFTSVIQMLVMVVVPSWGGPGWGKAAYILWWINTAMAVFACFLLPPLFIKTLHSEGGLRHAFTPVTQLPIIAALTSAAGAGTLCQYAMLSPEQKVPMIVVAYLEIGIGIPIALALDTLFWARQYLPWDQPNDGLSLPKRQIYVEMILCGPWGQGSFAMQGLGNALLNGAFDKNHGVLLTHDAGRVIGYSSIFFGLVCWGASLFWWFFACMGIVHALLWKKGPRFTFTLTNWSVVFPWVSLCLLNAHDADTM